MKYFFFLFAVLLVSCNTEREIKIIRDSPIPAVLVFDGEDTVHLKSTIDSVMLSGGQHTFRWNGKEHSFNVDKRDGLLNLDGSEFVKMEVTFSAGEGMDYGMYAIPMDNFIVIDSFLICRKGFEKRIASDQQRKTILDSIAKRKNGNYSPMTEDFKRKPHMPNDDYDNSDKLDGFKKIGGQNLFIEKTWDFDIGQKVPDQISVKGRSQSQYYRQAETKVCLLHALQFLFYAKVSPNEYSVADVRLLMRKK